jgi:L-ascorbate metabolism protein UlaG (beta-lactamase superfamily)
VSQARRPVRDDPAAARFVRGGDGRRRLDETSRLWLLYEDGTPFGSAVGGRCDETIRALCAPIVRCAAKRGIAQAVEKGPEMLAHALRRGRLRELYARPGVLKQAFLFPPRAAVAPKALLVQSRGQTPRTVPLPRGVAGDLAAWIADWRAGAPAPAPPGARRVHESLVNLGVFGAGVPRPPVRLGQATLVGHATVRLATPTTSLLFDPFLLPPDPAYPRSYQPLTTEDLGRPDAVFITHSHPDHFDIGTLLRFGADMPIYVPSVPRESVLAVDMRRRLQEVGFRDVRSLEWFDEARVGDFRVVALPFYGEQPTTDEVLHPEVRNRGNIYLVEEPQRRYVLTVDGGRDHAGDVKRVAADARRRFGAADVVFGGYRGFALYPAHYVFSSIARFLPFVPPSAWGVRQKIMGDAADLIDVAEIWGARRVVPYGDGGAPWFWTRGLGPRLDVPASSPGERETDPRPEEVLAVARARSSSPRGGTIRSAVAVSLLRPGDSLAFGARGQPRLRRASPHAWPYDSDPSADRDGDLEAIVRAGDSPRVLRKKVMLRLLAEREVERLGLDIPDHEVQALADALRRRLGLSSAADTRAWLRAQHLTRERFAETVRALAAVGVLERRYAAAIDEALPIQAAIARAEGPAR